MVRLFTFIDNSVNRSIAILFLLFLQFVNMAFHTFSIFDRNEIKNVQKMSREMLDARARIQIIVIQKNYDKFTDEEKQFIRENWEKAEYNRALDIGK